MPSTPIVAPFPAARLRRLRRTPALRALTAEAGAEAVSDSDWVCGTPHVLRAVAQLRQVAP